MSNIVIHSKEASQKFLDGKAVFKITSSKIRNGKEITTDRGIVTTLVDYQKLLLNHEYISIVHLAPLIYKIAYVCECLNLEKGKPRNETFIFWYRELSKHEWHKWFTVQPYKD